jgi:hypothetical protein
MRYFWEDWNLMQWLDDERPEVYRRYMDRVIGRAIRLPPYDRGRLIQYAYRKAAYDARILKQLQRLVTKSKLRVITNTQELR